MADAPLPTNLNRARELKIEELSRHFANDDLSIEDLERRIERVYKALNVAELDAITSDLRMPAVINPSADMPIRVADSSQPAPPMTLEAPRSRLLAIMSSMRRTGRWNVPRDLSVFAMMSDTRLDLTKAALPVGGVVNIHMTTVMAAFKVIVPPGMRVVNEMHSVMSDVRSAAEEVSGGELTSARTPVIRLTGTAVMSEVKVKVRRREEPVYDDEE